MPAVPEIARLKRDIAELIQAVEIRLKAKAAMSPGDRQILKSDIEVCMQQLDELRTRLAR
jgi:hypothetical protein